MCNQKNVFCMEKTEKTEKEKYHDFCVKFRGEIKAQGLQQVIRDLVTSTSDKVPLRKEYLTRECKKNSFRNQFQMACETLMMDRQLKPAIRAIQQEIMA